ncbi:MAG: hypothetical protein K6B45_05865 [Bacteroidaceae bacterium]|nr:hypothetical protein [Bacteroidaceae bacterium]
MQKSLVFSALSPEGINKANGEMRRIAFLLLVKLQQDKEEILPKQRPDKVSQIAAPCSCLRGKNERVVGEWKHIQNLIPFPAQYINDCW